MAYSSRRQRRSSIDIWPGFVDALTQLVIPVMRQQDAGGPVGAARGRIVNIGSVAGRIARPFFGIRIFERVSINGRTKADISLR